ncbi:hypothetical protein HMPREF3208_00677 [Gardnerella vaginalis]|uniref:Uncharacterized protein n=1 Tax=Gardnerella vaginalis TaxID=2702 RepID=A0A133NXI8_GARVA|nr:hypothetical protein HMPREF3208_00677 [Gardnerella vaginalis]
MCFVCADDLLSRCDLARESNSERKLVQVGSPVDFQREFRKRALIARVLSRVWRVWCGLLLQTCAAFLAVHPH